MRGQPILPPSERSPLTAIVPKRFVVVMLLEFVHWKRPAYRFWPESSRGVWVAALVILRIESR